MPARSSRQHGSTQSLGMRVLDACAAPGGKTAHLAELGAPTVTLLEVDAARAQRIDDNLRRASLRARVIIGDAAHPETWMRRTTAPIRIDSAASCSMHRALLRESCGVIPDIPWLRRPAPMLRN